MHLTQSRERSGLESKAYARRGNTGGARGGKGLSDNRGTGKYTGCTAGENSSVGRKTKVGGFVVTGSISILMTDCTIERAEVLSRTARRIGLGL